MKQLLLVVGVLFCLGSNAQELPKLSPYAQADYIVGLTKISLQYSRPSVRGRVIFGELVPFNEVWRLGANEPTKITTSTELIFKSEDGVEQKLPAGTHAIFAFPSKDLNWKIVFNSDVEQWGAGSYNAEKDLVSLKIKAIETSFTETLLIEINEVTTTSASINIHWDKLKITIPFAVNTNEQAQKNIQDAIATGKDLDKVYMNAANYYFNIVKDNGIALKYINESINVKETHNNVFLKARILYASGETKEAIKLGEHALKLAEEAKDERWTKYISETLSEWKSKK